ncbi:hypothetical protein ACOSP7_017239 [Xanthoceras sorbifolium]
MEENSKIIGFKGYGDNDLVVPHISTENWISTLNLTVDEDWRAWFVDGQIALFIVYNERKVFFLLLLSLFFLSI